MPAVQTMAQQPSDLQLQFFLDDIDGLLFPLLQWILKTTRSTINLIPERKRVKACADELCSANQWATFFPSLIWKSSNSLNTLSKLIYTRQEFDTPYQFQVVSTMPEHERRFRRWRDQARLRSGSTSRGSFNAFHGSGPANWHSILRTGRFL